MSINEASAEKAPAAPRDAHIRVRPEQLLDMLPIAGYACDRDGLIIHYNRAATELWGQAPALLDPNQRFCGSFRLYLPDGTLLPHTECQVANTLRTGTPARDQEVVIERPNGSRVGVLANIEALQDDAGNIVGAISWLREAPARASANGDDNVVVLTFEREVRENARSRAQQPTLADRAEIARQQTVRYFHELLLTLPAAVYTTDAAGRITFYNDAAADLWGCRPELGKSEFCGSWKIYWPDGTFLPHDQCPMAKALREKKPNRGMEAIAERPDGSRVPFMPYPSPIFDAAGNLIGAVNMLVDLTELKRGEETGARLASIVESSQDAIVSKTLDGILTSWNRGAEQLFGYTSDEAIGQPITMLIPDDRTAEEALIIGRISRGERVESYETVRRRKDGTHVPVSLTVSPVRDRTGKIIGASKIARDITERKRSDEQRELLLREMNHRVKNLFALTSGMVSLSQRSSRTAEEMATNVRGRLHALASAHELTLPPWSPEAEMGVKTTTLKTLLNAIVAPHTGVDPEKERVVFDGPDVPVAGKAVTSLALLLHEFTTNAAKYGALSAPSGYVEVTCIAEESRVLLTWTEEGGPSIDGDAKAEGFGSMLARQTVTGQFGGSIAHHWRPAGLTIELSLVRDRLLQ
jgi:PAS domain S-box-containing protein